MYTTSPDRQIVEIALDEWRGADASGRATLARALDGAVRDPGVFLLRPTADMVPTIAEAVAATRAFFALPLAAKQACLDPVDQFVGYRGLGANRNTYGGADLKEMYHIGPRHAPTLGAPEPVDAETAMRRSSLWPDLPEFVVAWHRYYTVMQELAGDLRELFALALGIDADALTEYWTDNSADLAANFYPTGDPSYVGQVRNAVHCDETFFTVLHQDGTAGGLSIEWGDGTWTPVALDGTAFLVNIGRLFELVTAGAWRAVPHQVEPVDAADGEPRLTIPFFFRPRPGVRLQRLPGYGEPDPSPPTLAEWLAAERLAVAAPINAS